MEKQGFKEIKGSELETLVSFIKDSKLRENSSIHTNHFINHPNACLTFLAPKGFFNDLNVYIEAYGSNIEQQKTNNKCGLRRAKTGYYGEYILNSLMGIPSLNLDTFSSFSVERSQSDTGHLNCKLECKTRILFSKSSHTIYKDTSYAPHNNDECLISIADLNKIDCLSNYMDSYDYLVIVHGVMEYEYLKHYQNLCHPYEIDDSKKICLCYEIYENLIPLKEYVNKDLHTMISLYHFMNGGSNDNYRNLMRLCMYTYIQKYADIFKNKGKPLKLYNFLLDDFMNVHRDFMVFLRSKGVTNKNYIIKGLFPVKDGRFSFYNFELHVDSNYKKTSLKVIRTNDDIDFSIPFNKKAEESEIENFLYYNNLFTFPLLGYGIRGLFGKIQKNYVRPLCNNSQVEHTGCFMDIFDTISCELPEMLLHSDRKGCIFPNQTIKTNIEYNWDCKDIEVGLYTFLLHYRNKNYMGLNQSDICNELSIIRLNIRKRIGSASSLSDTQKQDLKLIPFFVIASLMYKLLPYYLHSDGSNKVNKFLGSHLVTPNGLYNYSDDINEFLASGVMPSIKFDYKETNFSRIGKKDIEEKSKKGKDERFGSSDFLLDSNGINMGCLVDEFKDALKDLSEPDVVDKNVNILGNNIVESDKVETDESIDMIEAIKKLEIAEAHKSTIVNKPEPKDESESIDFSIVFGEESKDSSDLSDNMNSAFGEDFGIGFGIDISSNSKKDSDDTFWDGVKKAFSLEDKKDKGSLQEDIMLLSSEEFKERYKNLNSDVTENIKKEESSSVMDEKEKSKQVESDKGIYSSLMLPELEYTERQIMDLVGRHIIDLEYLCTEVFKQKLNKELEELNKVLNRKVKGMNISAYRDTYYSVYKDMLEILRKLDQIIGSLYS